MMLFYEFTVTFYEPGGYKTNANKYNKKASGKVCERSYFLYCHLVGAVQFDLSDV